MIKAKDYKPEAPKSEVMLLAAALGFDFVDGAFVKKDGRKTRKTGKATVRTGTRRKQRRALDPEFYDSLFALDIGGVLDATEQQDNIPGLTFRKLRQRISTATWTDNLRHNRHRSFRIYRQDGRTFIERTT